MSYLFMGYASEDADAAHSIAQALVNLGISLREQPLPAAGAPRTDDICRQVREAECLLILWSQAGAQSGFVQHEMQQAVNAWSKGRLLLAALDGAVRPRGLRDLQAFPIRRGAAGFEAGALLAAVRDLVGPAETERPASAPVGASPAPVAAPSARARVGAADSRPPPAPAALPAPVSAATHPPARSARPGRIVAAVSILAAVTAAAVFWFVSLAPRRVGSSFDASPGGQSYVVLFVAVALAGALIGGGLVWMLTRRRADAPSAVAASSSVTAAVPQPVAATPAAATAAIFVSCNRTDGRTVDALVKQIESAGYKVWIDRQSTGSQRYAAPIARAIRTSNLVALMCSRNAFESDHVLREVYVAGDYKKPFIAFQLDPTDFPDEVLYFVSGFPRIPVEALDPLQLRTEIARLVPA